MEMRSALFFPRGLEEGALERLAIAMGSNIRRGAKYMLGLGVRVGVIVVRESLPVADWGSNKASRLRILSIRGRLWDTLGHLVKLYPSSIVHRTHSLRGNKNNTPRCTCEYTA